MPFHDFPPAYYAFLQTQEHCVLLESTRYDQDTAHSLLFIDPIYVLSIYQASELDEMLNTLASYVQQGYFVAGYLSYECGYQLQKMDQSNDHYQQPLAWFGIYRAPFIYDHRTGTFLAMPDQPTINPLPPSTLQDTTYHIDDLAFDLSEDDYTTQFARIQEYIRAGDVYQVNFTGRYSFAFHGSPLALYQALKRQQPVPYSAYIRANGQDVLCFSPELFFRIQDQHILARPMKGTAPRGHTSEEDRQIAAWLASDTKNRAENVMIVDLLRNDLGRLCQIGSITVPELFTVERYTTLLQMTSTIKGTLQPNIDYPQLLRSLFPCGSVTGAPKIRAMEIIKELEHSPRGLYTGSIGYIAPSSASALPIASAQWNVAIRTIVLTDSYGTMGIGSGITSDSLASTEYAECLLKAQFLTHPTLDFTILEAILWDGQYQRLAMHLQRMAASAAYFDYAYDPTEVQRVLTQLSRTLLPDQHYKVRLQLKRNGQCYAEALSITPIMATTGLIIAVSTQHTHSQDRMYYHKTTIRPLYDRASRFAAAHGYADMIFLNERDEITEGATSNIFIEQDGDMLTPPLSCGLLNGVYRQFMLKEHPRAQEKKLTLNDIQKADHIYICNAIRGLRQVKLKPLAIDVREVEYDGGL